MKPLNSELIVSRHGNALFKGWWDNHRLWLETFCNMVQNDRCILSSSSSRYWVLVLLHNYYSLLSFILIELTEFSCPLLLAVLLVILLQFTCCKFSIPKVIQSEITWIGGYSIEFLECLWLTEPQLVLR